MIANLIEKIKSKSFKKFLGGLVVLVTCMSIVSNSYAAYATAKTGFKDGGKWSKTVCSPISGIYRYWVAAYKNTGVIYDCYNVLSPIIKHTKGKAKYTLTCTESKGVSYGKTTSWNMVMGAEYGISSTVKYSASKGYGREEGWTLTSSVARDLSVSESSFKNAATGYYAIAAGTPAHKMRVKKYNHITDKKIYTKYFYMPYGASVWSLVRSTDNQKTWSVYD